MEFKEVLTILKSLISSCPGKYVLVRDLEKDFEKLKGTKIPFQQLGYENTFKLIKDGMKEDFIIRGIDREAKVEISIQGAERLKHIMEFTANVKKNKQKNNNRNYSEKDCWEPKQEKEQWLWRSIETEHIPSQKSAHIINHRLDNPSICVCFPAPSPEFNSNNQLVFPHLPPTQEVRKLDEFLLESEVHTASLNSKDSEKEVSPRHLKPKRNYLKKQVLTKYILGYNAIYIHVIYSPKEFYFYFKSNICYLTPFLEEMNKFYHKNSNKFAINSSKDLLRNNIYVILYRNNYYRAQYKQRVDGSFKFFLCDFGYSIDVVMEEIFSIQLNFIKYPAIIFRGMLANIQPAHKQGWTKEAKELFYESVSDRLVWAKLTRINEIDMNYEMEVVLPDTEETMTSNLEREKLGVVVINDQF